MTIESINPGRRFVRRSARIVLLAATVIASTGIQAADDPIAAVQANDGNHGVVVSTTGGGHYLIGGSLDVSFSFSAKQKADGSANGQFRQSVVLSDQLIEFHGSVTCVTVDSVNHRAWIGGVVTKNNSEHPSFTTDIHQPGRDVWFRVLDSGEGKGDPDRSTFLGFEGGGGIITSQEYCDIAIWPDDNARTSPVTQGNIQVRP